MINQNLLQIIGITGAVISTAALIPYYKGLFSRKTKPNSTAFLIFGILATISFFGQLAAGAEASLWFAFVLMVNPFIIFALAVRNSSGEFAKMDKISLLVAALILIVWYFSKSAAIAIILTTLVNTIAKYLVAEKAYRLPHGDVASTWILSTVASALAVISVGKLDWVLLLSPVQNTITVGAIALIIIYRQRVVPTK